jgi:hypothetical protein
MPTQAESAVISVDARVKDTLKAFLAAILPANGIKCAVVFVGERCRHQFFATTRELADFVLEQDAVGKTSYHACATFRHRKGIYNERKKKWEVRCQANVLAVRCFWAEIDTREGKPDAPYADRQEAWKAVIAFCEASGMPLPAPLLAPL